MSQSAKDRSGRESSRSTKSVSQLTVQIIGEILVTLGIFIALFAVWQLWWTNVESSVHQKTAVENFFNSSKNEPKASTNPSATSAGNKDNGDSSGSLPAPGVGDILGIMYVPRFGTDYTRPIIEGTTPAELDTLGLGHYTDTALPGEIGNFAVAGHRQTHGAVFDNIDTLVPGDKIYVQTKTDYFTYVFYSSEIVLPEDVQALLPVPDKPEATPTEKLLTMTTCHPKFGSKERFIAYSRLENKRSIAEDPPSEIKNQVKKALGEK